MKNKIIFYTKWPSTGSPDNHLDKSLQRIKYTMINKYMNKIFLKPFYFHQLSMVTLFPKLYIRQYTSFESLWESVSTVKKGEQKIL